MHVLIWSLAIVLAATLGTYAIGVARANRLRGEGGLAFNSLPSYHGMLSASLVLLFGFVASVSAATFTALPNWLTPFAATIVSGIAAFFALQQITPEFRARRSFETIVQGVLLACSVVAVLTTVGIFASVAFESFAFFHAVNPFEFLFGTKWTPTGSPPSFGFIPLLAGTALITIIAIGVAAPLGLLSAIYMAEYASPKLRQTLKPLLEMLAGIPTVVLGFFAALTVAPLIRNTGEGFGLVVSSESALAAGLVMGMMIVPLISSLSDDIINSVPQSLRDGSYAMGATHSETIKRVVLPAALPGIVSAIMLAISRAVGETMIVVMAAGLAANLSFNPLAAVSTITVQIATLLVGDQEFDSPKTLSAFALGIVLFFFTLALNYVALRFVKKYRQAYD
jgi:phosphate transport system permease protein